MKTNNSWIIYYWTLHQLCHIVQQWPPCTQSEFNTKQSKIFQTWMILDGSISLLLIFPWSFSRKTSICFQMQARRWDGRSDQDLSRAKIKLFFHILNVWNEGLSCYVSKGAKKIGQAMETIWPVQSTNFSAKLNSVPNLGKTCRFRTAVQIYIHISLDYKQKSVYLIALSVKW